MNSRKPYKEIVNLIQRSKLSIPADDEGLFRMLQNQTPIQSYTLRPNELHHTIKKIDIHIVMQAVPARPGCPKTAQAFPQDIIVQLTLSDSSLPEEIKQLYRLPMSSLKHLLKLLTQADAIPESAFLKPRVPAYPVRQWNNLSLYDNYGTKLHDDYSLIRKMIAQKCIPFLKNANQILSVLDVGTGLGDCLEEIYIVLNKNLNSKESFQLIGIDTNAKNIDTANKRFVNRPFKFSVNDTKELDQVIEKYISKDKAFVIVTGSGSMTRLVLNNTLEVLQTLQKAYRCADVVILGGETALLTTQRLAKKMGWHCSASVVKAEQEDVSAIYVLSHEELPLPKIKGNHLDLSMNANPLQVIAKFNSEMLDQIEILDLGLAYIMSDEVEQLLAKLPNLKTILLSGLENSEAISKFRTVESIEVKIERSVYVDDELEDTNKWELKKHSKNFYKRAHNAFFSDKSIPSLAAIMKSKKEIYTFPEYESELEQIKAHIERLEMLAQRDDDVAIYTLAVNLSAGVMYTGYDNAMDDDIAMSYTDLEKSLKNWKLLLERGYAVSPYIEKVQEEILQELKDKRWMETKKNSQ